LFCIIYKQENDLMILCVGLSQEESSTGRFLKSQSNIDKTRAGKMMAAVGKSQSFSAQQR
jgi:hypothetical protein